MDFLKDLVSSATELATSVQDYALNKSELEKKLDAALSDANWGTPTSTLREIAAATSHGADFALIMGATWAAANPESHSWRQVYKALQLLEHLIKFGGERCVSKQEQRGRAGAPRSGLDRSSASPYARPSRRSLAAPSLLRSLPLPSARARRWTTRATTSSACAR